MKKILSALLVLCLACSLSSATLAYSDQQEISVYIDNQLVSFDVAPVIENGRTLVPMRAIFEALNTTVEWDNATQTVIARTEYMLCIELQIGNPVATKYFRTPSDDFNFETNEGTYQIDQLQEITLDVPAKLMDGRTIVPLRFIAESMDYDVKWDGANNRVDIITGNEGFTTPPDTTDFRDLDSIPNIEEIKEILSTGHTDSAQQISVTVNQHYMNLLAANRSHLYTHDLIWLGQLKENLEFIKSPNFDQRKKIFQIKEKLDHVASLTPDNQEYNKLLLSTQGVDNMNIEVLSRIPNSEHTNVGNLENNEKYMDKYMIYDDEEIDGLEAILITSEKIQQGYLSTYLKYLGKSQYILGNGFEEELNVFKKLTDAEVQQYFIDLKRMEELVGKTTELNHVIGELIMMVNEYAALNPPPITDSNYLDVYVNMNSKLPADFIERIELKSDGTFILDVNYADYFEGMVGTYKKEGSIFKMKPDPENNDPDFTLEISNGVLIYHGGQLGWISGESQFVK